MNKPVILVLQPDVAGATAAKAAFMKRNIKYSDDFVETEEAIYFVRVMPITFDMDKILLSPPEGKITQYDIQGWLDGLERKIGEIKKLANYNPGNVQNTPPPQFATAPPARS